jgi:hypothetical protein
VRPLFSVTLEDCRVDTFRAGGPGGQNQNKVESGVRVTHEPSGAVGVARDSRDQHANRRAAFSRMAHTEEFMRWARAQGRHLLGQPTPEELVAVAMQPCNLRLEVRGARGWEEAEGV